MLAGEGARRHRAMPYRAGRRHPILRRPGHAGALSGGAGQPQKRRMTSYRTGSPKRSASRRDPLVDAVEAIEEALARVEAERREAVGRGAQRDRRLGVGGERRHERQRDAVRVVVADRVATACPTADPIAGESTGGPQTMSSIVARREQLRPDALLDQSSGRRPRSCPAGPARRPRRSLAGDDVVLDPGVDDVRRQGVAEQRAQDPGVHRLAQLVELGVGRRIAARQPAQHARGRPAGARRSRRRGTRP